MHQDIYLVHRPGPSRIKPPDIGLSHEAPTFSFETCMRHILVSDAKWLERESLRLQSHDQIFQGDEAYGFLLEVLCGLHSPLVGETEVFGQFKLAMQRIAPANAHPWELQFQRWSRSLFEDVKKIRSRFLEELGSQSYGSLLRRELKGFDSVDVIGAGHLAQEVLPWIAKAGVRVAVHARDPLKARAVLGDLQTKVEVHPLSAAQFSALDQSALIVAAPISSEETAMVLMRASNMKLLIDLRETSGVDPVETRLTSLPKASTPGEGTLKVIPLEKLLARISSNRDLIEKRREQALQAIAEITLNRRSFVELRPFGWDDVSA